MSNDFETDEEVQAFDRARDEAPNMGVPYERLKHIWVSARTFFTKQEE